MRAFEEIKAMLTSAPVLRNPDWSKPFALALDWRSVVGVGACLSQGDDSGMEHAMCFASRMNSSAESAICSYEGEISAFVYVVHIFGYWLWGARFTLVCSNRHCHYEGR
jgi:hypothetical protein